MDSTFDADIERLLAQRDWLERLAHGLVRDPAAADDLAQDTLVRAMGRGAPRSGSPRALRGWLATVLRHLSIERHRSEVRRRNREKAVAPFESGDRDALERAQLRRDLVDEVLRLEEPERSAITLRYLEDLPYTDIAARQNVPEATVRQRVSRGLARLRDRLDEQPGGRSAWWALVLPWVPRHELPVASSAGTTLTQWACMKMSAKAAVTITVLLLCGGGLFARLHLTTADTGEGAASVAVPSTSSGNESPTVLASVSTPQSPARIEGTRDRVLASLAPLSIAAFPERSEAETGSIEVRVRWHDGTVAAGATVKLVPWGDASPRLRHLSLTTDKGGIVMVDRIAAGTVGVYLNRSGGGSFDVDAGALTVAEVTIPRGFTVVGRVLGPSGAPVAGAEITLSGYGSNSYCHVVGRTDSKGEYRVRDLVRGHSISARAPEFGPSWNHLLEALAAGETCRVDLELLGGEGVINGHVQDESGTPIQGAQLKIEFARKANSTGGPLYHHPMSTESDAEGLFEFRQCGSASVTLSAETEGYVTVKMSVNAVGPEEARAQPGVTVVMMVGGTVTGTVRRADGGVASGAGIAEVSPSSGLALRHRQVMVQRNGTFLMLGVPTGKIELRADERDHGRAHTTLSIRKGETAVWNPTLKEGRIAFGRVVDERGAGLRGWTVGTQRSDGHSAGRTRTDVDGQFRLTQIGEDSRDLHVEGTGRATGSVLTVPITDGMIVICIPDSALPICGGRVLIRVEGRTPGAPVLVRIEADNGGRREVFTDATGTAHWSGLCPGKATIVLAVAGCAPAWRTITLLPDGTMDAGVIDLSRGGQIRVEVVTDGGIQDMDRPTQVTVHDQEGRLVTFFGLVDGSGTSGPIDPGEYTVRQTGRAWVDGPVEVLVANGGVTDVRIKIEPAGTAALLLSMSDGSRVKKPWTYEVLRPGGEVIASGTDMELLPASLRESRLFVVVPFEPLIVRVRSAHGFGAEVQVVFEDDGNDWVQVDLVLTADD